MERDEEEIIKSLLEPMAIDEVVLNGLIARPCRDGNRMLIYGWAEMPNKITPEADVPAERIIKLRAIVPTSIYQDFIRREAERLGIA